MFARLLRLIPALALLAPLYAAPAVAGPFDKLVRAGFPQCDDAKVLKRIVKRFNKAEDKTWNRGFYLEEIERIQERNVRQNEDLQIPRRYCRGHALLTNGKHPALFFLIESGTGLAGNGFSVEFCLAGYDRWREFDGSCRSIKY